jgi:hypothetical protein
MITKIQEQVILGSLCGDGRVSGHSPNYVENHSLKQKEYLLWKRDLLMGLNPKITEYKSFHKKTKKYYRGINMYISSRSDFLKYRKLFYNGVTGNKVIRFNALRLLEPLALAIWYMDDGSYNYYGRIVALTSSIDDYSSQKNIKRYFASLGMACRIQGKGDYNYITLSIEASDKFLKLIRRYVPDCMKYKLGHLCGENSKKLDEFVKKKACMHKLWRGRNKKHIQVTHRKYYLDVVRPKTFKGAFKVTVLKDLQDYAKSRGGICTSKKYIGLHKKHGFKCSCGYRWDVIWKNMRDRQGWCPKCTYENGWDKRIAKYGPTGCK